MSILDWMICDTVHKKFAQPCFMWMVCYAVDRSDGGGDHKTIVEHPQRACAAPVHLRRHAAAVRVTYQLSWWWDWDAGRHGRRHAWSRVCPLRRHITDRQQQHHRCVSVRQQVRHAHFSFRIFSAWIFTLYSFATMSWDQKYVTAVLVKVIFRNEK